MSLLLLKVNRFLHIGVFPPTVISKCVEGGDNKIYSGVSDLLFELLYISQLKSNCNKQSFSIYILFLFVLILAVLV